MSPNVESPDPAAALTFDDRPGWRSRRHACAPERRAPRLALIAALTALHALLVPRLLEVAKLRPAPAAEPAALWVEWITPPAAAPLLPSPRPPRAVAPSAATSQARRSRALPALDVPAAAARTPVEPPPPPARARLFRADGSIALPAAVIDDLAQATRADRAFSYRLPGVEEALSFAHRPAPLEYRATRFDAAWAPTQNVLSEALEKAVEKTTATITIPIPRNPGSRVVCKVSLVGMGGGCGIVNDSDGYFVALDDPATLDADEDRACQAWWDRILATTTFEEWRALMDRYEAQCRKPRLADETVPDPAGAQAAPSGARVVEAEP